MQTWTTMKTIPTVTLTTLSALVTLAACSSSGETRAEAATAEPHRAITTERLEPYECGTITRLHTLGGVFLASQPAPEDFEQAALGGVRTVIDLRKPEEHGDFDERAFVEGLGLAYISLPWNGPAELTDEVFDEARRLLNEAERPILLHCKSANRVGAVWLPWRVLDGGIPVEEATEEARVVGLKSPAYLEKALDYVRRESGAE